MNTFDLHCDTIIRLYYGKSLRDMEDSHINLNKLKAGGTMVQCFAIFVESNEEAASMGITDTPAEYLEKAYRRYIEETDKNTDLIRRAYTYEDLIRNRDAGLMSAVLTIEDGVTLDGRIENVDLYHKMGVRMVALTWNYENSLGYPNSADPKLHMLGLKPFGKEAVERMNELGIIVDVSHLSEGGFYDVATISKKPFIASHSCPRALFDHSRNLTDDQLKTIGNAGGIVGLNFFSRFLHDVQTPDQDYTSIAEISRALQYIKNTAGTEALALGSDYDGIGCQLEWGDSSGNALLLERLSKDFTGRELDMISHENAMRVFREVL